MVRGILVSCVEKNVERVLCEEKYQQRFVWRRVLTEVKLIHELVTKCGFHLVFTFISTGEIVHRAQMFTL